MPGRSSKGRGGILLPWSVSPQRDGAATNGGGSPLTGPNLRPAFRVAIQRPNRQGRGQTDGGATNALVTDVAGASSQPSVGVPEYVLCIVSMTSSI